MKPRFAVHPAWIESRNDGDWHYISAAALARLYELKHDEYVVWVHNDEIRQHIYNWDDFIHLYPDYYGRYGRPNVNEIEVRNGPKR